MRVREQAEIGWIGPLVSAAASAGMAVYQRQAAKKAAEEAKKRAEAREATEAAQAAKAESDIKLVESMFAKRASATAATAAATSESGQTTDKKLPTLAIVGILGGGAIVAGVAIYLILKS